MVDERKISKYKYNLRDLYCFFSSRFVVKEVVIVQTALIAYLIQSRLKWK